MEDRFGLFINLELGHAKLIIDDESRVRLLQQAGRAMNDAADQLRKYAEGDYSPTAYQDRFPELELVGKSVRSAPRASGGIGLSGLVEGWWREAQATGSAKPSTHQSYQGTMTKFIAFMGHDDASRVTPEDIIRFKDHRLAHPG